MELRDAIIDAIRNAKNAEQHRIQVFKETQTRTGKNEFLFFIKPEITILDNEQRISVILDTLFGAFGKFKMNIADVLVLSSAYLQEHDIIARHYGVINKISVSALPNMSEAAIQRFTELYGRRPETCEVLGSIEFLKVFNEFTPLTLDYLWQNKKFEKLAGGTYSLDLDFNGRKVYLINGFHPRQLDHFTRPGRCIVTFTLRSDTSWKEARSNFIGTTDPAKALPGSLRRFFLENQNQLGLSSVSASWNGVHLSAGPVEALAELIRFNTDHTGQKQTPNDYLFGKQLVERFSAETVQAILANETVQYQGRKVSVFDLTEEKDSDEALKILSEIF